MNWIEGEPKEDGLYAVMCLEGPQEPPIVPESKILFCSRGVMHWPCDSLTGPRCKWLGHSILRHYRLPEPQPPLEPLRRFRAKLNGESRQGVLLPNSKSSTSYRMMVFIDGGWGIYQESDLTEIEWLDKETP